MFWTRWGVDLGLSAWLRLSWWQSCQCVLHTKGWQIAQSSGYNMELSAWGGRRLNLHTVLALAPNTSTGTTLGHVGHHAWHAQWRLAVLSWLLPLAAVGHLGYHIMKPASQKPLQSTTVCRKM